MRILVVSAPFGEGHARAGDAIARACEKARTRAQCVRCDLRQVRVLRLAGKGYLAALRYSPRLWRALYTATSKPAGLGWAGRFAASAVRGALEVALARNRPDLVVATHPFPAGALSRMRASGTLRVPLAVAVTDFLPHPAWVHAAVDRYFVAPMAARGRLEQLGVPPARIAETGIPIAPGFRHGGRAPLPRVLVMGGSLGMGPLPYLASQLASLLPWARVDVVAGSNRGVFRKISALRGKHPNIHVYGFAREVHRLMRQADLLVGKPGGLTSSEALASGLPMLMVGTLPGHEEENALVLEQAGAGRRVESADAARYAHHLLTAGRSELAFMRKAALALGRPRAAADVAAELLHMAGGVLQEDLLAGAEHQNQSLLNDLRG